MANPGVVSIPSHVPMEIATELLDPPADLTGRMMFERRAWRSSIDDICAANGLARTLGGKFSTLFIIKRTNWFAGWLVARILARKSCLLPMAQKLLGYIFSVRRTLCAAAVYETDNSAGPEDLELLP